MALYHGVKGPVNYTVVGSPTIVDGVASGFSNSDYFTLPYLPGETTPYFTNRYPFELVIKFKKESSATQQIVYGDINILADNTVQVHFNNGSNTVYIAGTTVIQINTYYYVKVVYDGSDVYYYLKEENGTYILQGSSNNNVTRVSDRTFFGCRPGRLYLDGIIDLSETYIKVNGQPWFGVCPIAVQSISYNNQAVQRLVVNGTEVWRKTQ